MNYGAFLTVGILFGIFATEFEIDGQCSKAGQYESWFLNDIRCAPIVKVSTMEEAKKQIEINQAMTGVKG